MDLKELWNNTESRQDQGPERAELEAMLSQQSTGILAQLRRKLLYKILWGAGLGIALLVMLALYPHNAGIWIFAALFIPLVVILDTILFRHYQRLPNRLDMSREILPVMKEYDQIIRAALRKEERIGNWFIIPSPAVGAMISMLEDENTIGDIMTDGRDLLVLLVLMIVISPFAIWLSKWMNKVAFGKYLKQLRSNIEALENLEGEG